MIRNTLVAGALALTIGGISAAPAVAAPNPNPAAPEHTGTACMAVLTHNPQTTEDAHQAPPAQMNFFAVGEAMCGL